MAKPRCACCFGLRQACSPRGFLAGGWVGSCAASWRLRLARSGARRMASGQQPRGRQHRRFAALKAKFARPTFVPQPADNPPTPPRSRSASACSRTRSSPRPAPSPAPPATIPSSPSPTASPPARASPASASCATRRRCGTWPGARCCSGTAAPRAWKTRSAFPSSIPTRWAPRSRTPWHASRATTATSAPSREAFPHDPEISARNIARALAAYERTLVSPPTRFDTWVAGDAAALSPSEVNGLRIFAGKGRCINCHTGFAFTDHGFYDIGLPGDDKGRGKEIGLPRRRPCLQGADPARAGLDRALHARRLDRHARRRRAHLRDGRRAAAHAQQGPAAQHQADGAGAGRPRSPSSRSLSSETPPQPSTEAWVGSRPTASLRRRPRTRTVVSQANKLFAPAHVRLGGGRR